MVPDCITQRNEAQVLAIHIAYEVHRMVDELTGHNPDYWGEQIPLVAALMRDVPDRKTEFKAIVTSIHTMTDDDLLWLSEITGPSYLRFQIVDEIFDHRPHLK